MYDFHQSLLKQFQFLPITVASRFLISHFKYAKSITPNCDIMMITFTKNKWKDYYHLRRARWHLAPPGEHSLKLTYKVNHWHHNPKNGCRIGNTFWLPTDVMGSWLFAAVISSSQFNLWSDETFIEEMKSMLNQKNTRPIICNKWHTTETLHVTSLTLLMFLLIGIFKSHESGSLYQSHARSIVGS